MNDSDNIRRTEDNRRPEEIESDLERTRAEMSETIDAIQHKLTPGQMMDQAFAYARTSLPADFGANLGNAVRDNPVPMALIGIGIGWLMMAGQNSDGHARMRRQLARTDRDAAGQYSGSYDSAYSSGAFTGESQDGTIKRAASKVSETGRGLKDRASETGRSIMDKASDLKNRVTGSTSSMAGRTQDMSHNARDRLHETTDQARARMNDLSHRSQEQYYRAKDSFGRMLEEQPLVLGVLGVAIGTLLGAALPSTRREDEMMGRTRDDLLEKAKDTAREQAEHLKESANRVKDVAKDEASRAATEATSRVRENGHAGGTMSPATSAGTNSDGMEGQRSLH